MLTNFPNQGLWSELCVSFDRTEAVLQREGPKKKSRFNLLHLAWVKFPVVDDACWDDGRVVPVTCAAVILAGVVALSGFARHTSCQITFSVKSWADKTFTQLWRHSPHVLHGLAFYRKETLSHSVKLACDTQRSGSPGGPVLSQGRCSARTPTGGWPLTWRMAWWSGSCTYCGSGSSNLKRGKDHHSWIQLEGNECDDGNRKRRRRILGKILGQTGLYLDEMLRVWSGSHLCRYTMSG